MGRPVFISYARRTSRDHAVALHNVLGGEMAFLDSEDIADGASFPERIIDALLDAQVVVIFAEPVYFTRWYCLLEFRIARTPYLRAVEKQGSTREERDEALRSMVVAFPPSGISPEMDRFPSLVSGTNWPAVTEPHRIAELVLTRLATNPPTLRGRYRTSGELDAVRAMLMEATRLPQPTRTSGIPFAPQAGLSPSIGEAFVGRADDLWRIHDTLTTQRGDIATAAGLTGSVEAGGGFGKTRLALEYLHRFGPRYFPGGLFWIDADQDPEAQQYEILLALDEPVLELELLRRRPGGVAGSLARAIRSLPPNRPALFVVDNVPEPGSGESPRPLATWCPAVGVAAVIATSRMRLSLGEGPVVVPIAVDVLLPEDAVALLTWRLGTGRLTNEEWGQIAEWVGYLPLALELLNRALASGALTPEAVLGASRRTGTTGTLDAAMDALRTSVPAGALRGITEALSISYDRLTTLEQVAARILACLAPAPLPEALLGGIGSKFFSPPVRAVLANRSFITPLPGAPVPIFGSMHRVLADFLRSQSPEPVEEATFAASMLYDATHREGDDAATRLILARTCAPHARSVLQSMLAEPNSSVLERAFEFAMDLGTFLACWAQYADGSFLFQQAISIAKNRWGETCKQTITAKNELANTLFRKGELAQAQEFFEEVIKASEDLALENPEDTLVSAEQLAAVLWERGEHVRALELQRSNVESYARLLGDEHSHTLAAKGQLAQMLQGEKARAVQEAVVQERMLRLGDADPATLDALSNLASTLRNLGDLPRAREINEEVYAKRYQVLGPEHPDTLASLNNLANVLRESGEFGRALELQERCLEARERLLGREHFETLKTVQNLGNIHGEMGNTALALPLFERALRGYRALADRHPLAMRVLGTLAFLYQQLGNLEKAEEAYEGLYRAFGEEYGETDERTISVLVELSDVYWERGNLPRAIATQLQLLHLHEAADGPTHDHTLLCAWNLFLMLGQAGEAERSQAMFASYLTWLLDKASFGLTPGQQAIRTKLDHLLFTVGRLGDSRG